MKNNKYQTVGTAPKSRKTSNTRLSEQLQNPEKQQIPYCRNSSKIQKNNKYHIVGTAPKSRKTTNTRLSEQLQNLE